MLKRIKVTNYKNESMTYGIGDGLIDFNKNKIVMYSREEMRHNNSDPQGRWIGDAYTLDGITFTINRDESDRVTSIHVEGTSTDTGEWGSQGTPLTIGGRICTTESDLKLSGCTGGSYNTFYMAVEVFADRDICYNYSGDTTFTNDPEIDCIRIWVAPHATVNTTIYPMIRLASESNEYEPYDPDWDPGFLITSIGGLGPVKANINMTEIPTSDGSSFNSARATYRNIVLQGLFSETISVEEARHRSYKMFPIKSKVTLEIVSDTRTVSVEGYIESNEQTIFSNKTGCQVSILCPSSYLNGGKEEARSLPTNVEYIGDVPSGVKMNFSLPSDDPMESLSITRIDTFKDSNDTMAFNMTRMAGPVPNTAPNALPDKRCLFRIDNGDRCKFVKELPQNFGNIQQCDVVLFDGCIHLFCSMSGDIVGTTPTHHIIFDINKNEWIRLPDLTNQTFTNLFKWILSIPEKGIFGYVANGHTIQKFNENTNTFDVVIDYAPFTSNSLGTIACVFNGDIHIFNTDTSYGHGNEHYVFDGETLEYATDSYINSFIPSTSFTFSGHAVECNGELHILGQDSNNRRKHYIWDGNNTSSSWRESGETVTTFYEDYGSSAVSYGNDIHVLKSNGHVYWGLSTSNAWENLSELPISLGSQGYYMTYAVVYGDYMYVLNPVYSGSNTYTEPANNTKLIENDQLIIDTIKGEKSITLLRDGNSYNVLNVLERGSNWFELEVGDNQFNYSAEGDTDRLIGTIEASSALYEGV